MVGRRVLGGDRLGLGGGAVFVRRLLDRDRADQFQVASPVIPPPIQYSMIVIGRPQPGQLIIHINHIFRAIGLDFADHLILHLPRVRLIFHQRVCIYIAGGRVPAGKEISLWLRTDHGNAGLLWIDQPTELGIEV